MSWDRPFAQPVPLPKGPPAQTLRDAADYIRKLPQPERDCPEWRLAFQMLIDAAEYRGPCCLRTWELLEPSKNLSKERSIPRTMINVRAA